MCAISVLLSFPTWSQSSEEEYVQITTATERQLKKNIADYKKLISDHGHLEQMYKALTFEHEELLQRIKKLEQSNNQFSQESKSLELKIEQIKRHAEENAITIENLKKSLYYCRTQVGKLKRRQDNRTKKVSLNGLNSALE